MSEHDGRATCSACRIDPLTMDRPSGAASRPSEHGELLEIGVVNAAKIVNMRRDPGCRRGGRLRPGPGRRPVGGLGEPGPAAPLPERVAGIDLFPALLAEAERRALPVYFLGAKPEVLDQMLRRGRRRFPG